MSRFRSPNVKTTEKDLSNPLLPREVRNRLSGNSILGGVTGQIPPPPFWILSFGIWNDNGVWVDNQIWLDN